MPSEFDVGALKIRALRGGTVTELTDFLSDFEAAYVRLYEFEQNLLTRDQFRRRSRYLREFDYVFGPAPEVVIQSQGLSPLSIVPSRRLLVSKISIASPGFWEFIGSLNPLLQLREYLNDRHRRRQDQQYREQAERERLELDNELLQQQVFEKQNAVFRDRIDICRAIGMPDDQIRQLVWSQLGEPLSRLGRHQDVRLIEGANVVEPSEDPPEQHSGRNE